MDRFVNICHETATIKDTEGIKSKGRKNVLKYRLVILETFNVSKIKDLLAVRFITSIRDQNVSWNKVKMILKDRYIVNKSKQYTGNILFENL